MKTFLSTCVISAFACFTISLPAQDFPNPLKINPEEQFNFWIGEWDVNLRVRQPDNSWQDQHQAVARIYSILDGKAILELWSEGKEGINGYSLRYYDESTEKWKLWLNWPGKNRSGTSGLEGTFRHGRGEFFVERQVNDSTVMISRYTFSDITPYSLRWDDAYSTDGGKTWTGNWIMEFTRRLEQSPPLDFMNTHTYFSGDRCDLSAFSLIKKLRGTFTGSFNNNNKMNNCTVEWYQILDGCMALGFVKSNDYQGLFTFTYNTHVKVYELGYLDTQSHTDYIMYYGPLDQENIQFKMGKQFGESGEASLQQEDNQWNIYLQTDSKSKIQFSFKK